MTVRQLASIRVWDDALVIRIRLTSVPDEDPVYARSGVLDSAVIGVYAEFDGA